MIDDEIGHGYKNILNEMLWDEMVEKPDMRCFLNEKLSSSDKRILMCIYAQKAWEKTKVKHNLFKKIAKRMGFFNCRCGCENHFVNVGRLVDYKVPVYGSFRVKAMTLKQCLEANLENQEKRRAIKLEKRRQRNAERIMKNQKKRQQKLKQNK